MSVLRQAFDLEPKEAVEFLRQKGFRTTFNWAEMRGPEHEVGFTVAKMADMDLLKEVKQAVDKAITAGTTKKDFADSLEPLLQSRGWWGRKVVTDPNTGEEKEVQLGSARRLETIFRTNLKTAYAAGRYQQIQDTKEGFPFLMYDAVDDDRTRPEHAAWDGLVLPVDDDWWKTHYPPNGWNCRCCVIQVNDRMLSKMGKEGPDTAPNYGTRPWVNPATQETEQVPVGIDPGWDYAPGASRVDQVQEVLDEKLVDMPEDWVDATNRSMEAFIPKDEGAAPVEPDWTQIDPTEGETPFDKEEKIRLAKEIADAVEVAEIPAGFVRAFNETFKRLIEKDGLPRLGVMTSTREVGFIVINKDGLYINPDFIREAIAEHGSLERAFEDAKERKVIVAGNFREAAAHEGHHHREIHSFDEKTKDRLKAVFEKYDKKELEKISAQAAKSWFELYAEVQTMLESDPEGVPEAIRKDLEEALK